MSKEVQREIERIEDSGELNYLFVNRKGNIEDPSRESEFENPEAEDDYIDRILETDQSKVMIYIHGGLNTRAGSKARALEIQALGKSSPDIDLHPVFINWRSSGPSSYIEHLLFHREGEHWYFWGPVSSPFVLLEDLGRSIVSIPRSLFNTYNAYRKSYDFAYTPGGRNAYKMERLAAENDIFGSFTQKEDLRGKWEKVVNGARTTGTHLVSLGGNVAMEFFGPGSWNVMKRRAELMFVKAKPRSASNYDTVTDYRQLREGGVHKFLGRLKAKQKEERENGIEREYVLVGHSMGAIIANKILSSESNIAFDRIIYMGAACTISEFQLSVIPYLVNNPDSEFYNYTLHPLAENAEASWGGVGRGGVAAGTDRRYL